MNQNAKFISGSGNGACLHLIKETCTHALNGVGTATASARSMALNLDGKGQKNSKLSTPKFPLEIHHKIF